MDSSIFQFGQYPLSFLGVVIKQLTELRNSTDHDQTVWSALVADANSIAA